INLLEVTQEANPAPSTAPPAVTFPDAFLSYRVASGGATTVTWFLPSGVVPTTFWSYGAEPGKPAPHWYPFLFDGTTGAELLSGRIVLHFVDGGRGDNDLTANG